MKVPFPTSSAVHMFCFLAFEDKAAKIPESVDLNSRTIIPFISLIFIAVRFIYPFGNRKRPYGFYYQPTVCNRASDQYYH